MVHETECQFLSIQTLLEELERDRSPGLQAVLRKHTFVGLVDSETALVQFQTKLLLLHFSQLAQELFYQLAIRL